MVHQRFQQSPEEGGCRGGLISAASLHLLCLMLRRASDPPVCSRG